MAIVGEFANFSRGVRIAYHLTDHARVKLGQHLTQQVSQRYNVIFAYFYFLIDPQNLPQYGAILHCYLTAVMQWRRFGISIAAREIIECNPPPSPHVFARHFHVFMVVACQAFLLHGQESVELRWLPKPVAFATRMLKLLGEGSNDSGGETLHVKGLIMCPTVGVLDVMFFWLPPSPVPSLSY